MKKILKNLPIYLIVIFVLIQVPLTLVEVPKISNLLPEFSFKSLRSGQYGRELETKLIDSSFLSNVSSKKYRSLINQFFMRSNKKVIIGEENFLFLKGHTDELALNTFEKIPKILAYIEKVKDTLRDKNINLMLMIIPNRAVVYPEYAYESKKLPKNRARFFQEVKEKIITNGVKVLDLTNLLKWARTELKDSPAFFKVDHHWSYKAVEKITPEIVNFYEKEFGSVRESKEKPFDYMWEIKVNAHDKIARKLGFSRNALPNKFKQKQSIPIFDKDREEIMSYAQDKFMMISSSYGRYGFVEFLSNELGYPIPFYIERGKGPTHGMNKLVLRNLSQTKKYGIPKNVLWVVGETSLIGLAQAPPLALAVRYENLKELYYKVTKLDGGTFEDRILSHRSGKMKFNMHLKKEVDSIVIGMKIKSHYNISKLKYIDKNKKEYSREIVHDGEVYYYKFKSKIPSKDFFFEISTPEITRLKGNREFEIIGVYTE